MTQPRFLHFGLIVYWAVVAFGVGVYFTPSVALAAPISYNRQIRPILSENCFTCHGPDQNKRKAKLRLDDRVSALASEAIIPGEPDKSPAVQRVFTSDPEDQMPPPETHKKLTNEQKKLLRQWVAEGAPYEPHWSYLPPKTVGASGVRDGTQIDARVRTFLRSQGISLAPAADKALLIRRLSLDLIGLPPTPSEVKAFLSDRSAKAYERLVDRLLASPHYGERMAVPWLDLARYADTVGYHGDQNQNAFAYREYVIRAFNDNLPFDQFTREQLAGDLLPGATPEQRVASGFNRLNMVTREGGAQPKEYLAKYAADRVRTVATTWLGSTMACCECHDHKYDPFTAKDFYRMAAFFADVKQWGVYNDYTYTPNPDLKGFSNDHPFPPEISITNQFLLSRAAELRGELSELANRSVGAKGVQPSIRLARDEWKKWMQVWFQENPTGWRSLSPNPVMSVPSTNAAVSMEADVISWSSLKASSDKIAITLPPGWVASIRLELLPVVAQEGRILRKQANPFIQTSFAVQDLNAKERALEVSFAGATVEAPRYANGFAIIGIREGWKLPPQEVKEPQSAVYFLSKPFKAEGGEVILISLKDNPAAAMRFSVSPAGLSAMHDGIRTLTRSLSLPRSSAAWNEAYLTGVGTPEGLGSYRKVFTQLQECRGGRVEALVTEAWTPVPTRVLARGNWQDETGEVVPPGVPHFLPQPKGNSNERLTRLDLAEWLVSAENPLTARVFVNRIWKQFFGNGLSAVIDDFGAQGESPVHPDLLDYLAIQFRESGWNVKQLVREIVLSSTYRQQANPSSRLKDIDPHNRLLASQSPRRLDAEFIRDNALSIAGLLNRTVGGPSVKPYQPPGYYVNLQFPNRDYQADRDRQQYRRGIYMHWQRTFLHPMLANFDAPTREECTARRVVSNTPQQALTLLNDPSFVEAARAFAGKVLATRGSDSERLTLAWKMALARAPRQEELASIQAFLQTQRAHTQQHSEENAALLKVGLASHSPQVNPNELAAWTAVCRVLLNLHETVTLY